MVLVAHAPRESALRWLESSKVDFPLLIDESSVLYHQLGLRRVIKGLVDPAVLTYFVERELAGEQLVWPDKEDDTLDMGGDFIVNDKGARTALLLLSDKFRTENIERSAGCVSARKSMNFQQHSIVILVCGMKPIA